MTLQELRYVVAVAEKESFVQAAEACHVSQPTLSAQIRKLEEQLGVTLFERTNRRVRITPVGEAIVKKARHVIEECTQIGELAKTSSGPFSEPLRIGIIPTLGPYLLPWILPPIHKSHPGLRLTIREGLTAELVAELDARRLDALIAAIPVPGLELAVLPLFDEPFWLACPADHRLARRKRVSEKDLAGENLLLLTEGHCLRDQALDVCGDHLRVDPATGNDFRATSIETMRQLVAAGFGCTLLPALAVGSKAGGRAAIRTVRFEKRSKAYRRVGMVWRRSFPRVESLTILAAQILRHLPSGVTPLDSEFDWKPPAAG
jgi:LysR family hydrogen peroxide-inducible transcriptional activator